VLFRSLTRRGRDDFDFTFHSDHDTENPFITIRLDETEKLEYLYLENRTSSQFHDRAKGLTVWVSNDGESYRRLWQADEMKGQWMVEFPDQTKARFIRVGLDGKGTFHLNQAVVYGR